MGKKTVALSAYTAKRLEEYRGLQAKYEEIMKEVCGIDVYHPEDDEALMRVVLGRAIDDIKGGIDAVKCVKVAEVTS